MLMPHRSYASTANYRYGFNGKENDNEVKGEGNQQDYGLRIYDLRLVKFLSVDPLSAEYPWNSAYAFAENDVIRSIDLEGAEKSVRTFAYSVSNGQTISKVISNDYVQPKGTSNPYHSLCPRCPITPEEIVADGFQRANNLPDDGIFSFFVFSPELKKANYARYEYTDPGGKQQVRYFDAGYVDFMYDHFEKEQQQANKILNIGSAAAAAGGAGVLLKTELKAAGRELKPATSEANLLKGSGPVSGVLEVSSTIKSVEAFKNYKSSQPIEFVYDPTNKKFLVGQPNQKAPGLSGHQQLVKAGNLNNSTTVGGMFKTGENGQIITNEYSGHYYTNWTDEIRKQFKEFIQTQTGKTVTHTQ